MLKNRFCLCPLLFRLPEVATLAFSFTRLKRCVWDCCLLVVLFYFWAEASTSRSSKRASSCLTKQEEMAEDEMPEEGLHQLEKKRRLTSEQVKFLEQSFDKENKLEPERKLQIAKKLGLQPRQVAVWFQNRRASWKTKQLEHNFDALKAKYDAILKENEKLQLEIASLNTLLEGMNSQKDCFQTQAIGTVVTKKQTIPVLSAVDILPKCPDQSFVKAEDSSPQSELDSPTKSDQSEVLDSCYHVPASDFSVFSFLEDSAAAAIVNSDSLLECMYSPMYLQPVAVKLDGSILQDDYHNFAFTYEEPIFFPYYT